MAQFKNSEHEERYYTVLSKMKSTDIYHRAVPHSLREYRHHHGNSKAERHYSEIRPIDG